MSWLSRWLNAVDEWLSPRVGMPTKVETADALTASEYEDAAERDAELYDYEEWEELDRAYDLALHDPAKAFARYLDLAEGGSAAGMCRVGEAYYWGRGVAEDRVEALGWFRRAHKAGSKRGLLSYVRLLRNIGELRAAEAALRDSANNEWAPAMYWRARVLLELHNTREARSEARGLLERAAALGSEAAQWKLCELMLKGRFGLRSVPRAFRMFPALIDKQVDLLQRRKRPGRTTSSGATLH